MGIIKGMQPKNALCSQFGLASAAAKQIPFRNFASTAASLAESRASTPTKKNPHPPTSHIVITYDMVTRDQNCVEKAPLFKLLTSISTIEMLLHEGGIIRFPQWEQLLPEISVEHEYVALLVEL